jgi:hypothetical protein
MIYRDVMVAAAWIAVFLLAVVTVFQLALAFGAPLGAAAWGGRHPGVLPTRLRVASGFVAVFVYPVLAVFILGTANVIDGDMDANPLWLWILAGLFLLGALANFASRSKVERWWGLVSLGIAVCCAVIAIGS